KGSAGSEEGADMTTVAATTKGQLLVVDDEQALLRAYRRLFEREGYTVTTASNGNAATALLTEQRFDAVVTDIRMPGSGGLELLHAAHALDAELPVILITAAPAMDTAVQAVEYGAHRYLTKPVDLGELVRVLEQA